jgi:hypothetical protein
MNIKDHFITGFIAGLAAPLIAFSIYAKFRFPEEALTNIYRHVRSLGILSTMLSLSVFINLLVFFLFIWSKADRSSKGVLAATFLYAFFVVILKLAE